MYKVMKTFVCRVCVNPVTGTGCKMQPFYGPFSGTTRVSQYQNKHSLTHTYPDHQLSIISFLHLLRSIASSVFNLHA